jgi:hypothetical protein
MSERKSDDVEVTVCPPGYAWGYTPAGSSTHNTELNDDLSSVLVAAFCGPKAQDYLYRREQEIQRSRDEKRKPFFKREARWS